MTKTLLHIAVLDHATHTPLRMPPCRSAVVCSSSPSRSGRWSAAARLAPFGLVAFQSSSSGRTMGVASPQARLASAVRQEEKSCTGTHFSASGTATLSTCSRGASRSASDARRSSGARAERAQRAERQALCRQRGQRTVVVVVGGGEAGRRRCGGARGIAHERPAARRASFAARAKRPRRSREEAKGRQKIRARRGNMDPSNIKVGCRSTEWKLDLLRSRRCRRWRRFLHGVLRARSWQHQAGSGSS